MKMKSILTAAVMAAVSFNAAAAVSEEEAKQLGTTLTPWGAEKAGNADGSIPAYTGSPVTPPPGTSKSDRKLVNPFPDDKPLFRITNANKDKYKDKLSESQMYLMEKYPDTFFIDVYTTRRTAAFPKYWQDGSIYNATHAKMVQEKEGVEGAHSGIPFPIPKTGPELGWNTLMRFRYPYVDTSFTAELIDTSGRVNLINRSDSYFYHPFSAPDQPDTPFTARQFLRLVAPARQNGIAVVTWNYINYAKSGDPKVWIYNPGQRRVRLAPEVSYDTPNATYGGSDLGDESDTIYGRMDRYDFKILGKKEMYVPANDYDFQFHTTVAEVAMPGHFKTDKFRWELRRVWVLEATLAPGKRHVVARKRWYTDEDTWNQVMWDGYDASGKFYRSMISPQTQGYQHPNSYTPAAIVFDHSRNTVAFLSHMGCDECMLRTRDTALPENTTTPDNLLQQGIR
ncbi:MAG: hypothetical protein JWQ90_3819 [Hydrocarboniphaga sp.]|uniref:DUF1329 domain-containing protein n=1 Tax=Hydrocarboniphaga sp. TaxID=2033016 RepID=UPI00261DB98C|nr:DUF1329 domain-containing protein [Hydrocarboniphaga sp.]MDB5971369.1 hypothetical protein [Hydrocarboniphaga sp.]